ncbi:hypothetical protein BCR37DRAFT_46255 [Protomyces lactucae-debilis]|uniref:Uncharacterized protein n=1 Tax=Protomyces lactucae-debilis TaxID=2754530 RepID=A0A1Y2FC47_PROLT|nr:uncharacterized protein BCR37DRAFT_46255 [Protomyces lactucae-debilis]ORY81500.1 hypothetical protein BCR37DRAFT_46255 [Protomyces lactucae-debilis]
MMLRCRCLPSHSLRLIRYSSSSSASSTPATLDELFAKPSWSTSTLLAPPSTSETPIQPISEEQLAHLYKLSALQLPQDSTERLARRRALATQLHFVRLVHEVDTTGIQPLHNVLASQHTSSLTYDAALAVGQQAKERFKLDDAQCATGQTRLKPDYTKLAKRTRGRFYTVSGGLVNKTEQ